MAEIQIQEVTTEAQASNHNSQARVARLVLGDFVVTSLLRQGRSLRAGQLAAAADGFRLTRSGLRVGLEGNPMVDLREHEWDLTLRSRRTHTDRYELSRQPISSSIEDLLRAIGKPLPLSIIVRELSLMRAENLDQNKAAIGHVLQHSYQIVQTSTGNFLHRGFLLETHMPTHQVVDQNQLSTDPDWTTVAATPVPAGDLQSQALAVLHAVRQPLSLKMLEYLLWKDAPAQFDSERLFWLLGQRDVFVFLAGGYVAARDQLAGFYQAMDEWLRQQTGGPIGEIDVSGLLRQRLAAEDIRTPSEHELNEVAKYAERLHDRPLELSQALMDVLETEPTDDDFVPALQGLNDALRRDPRYLPVGIGRFLLRTAVPAFVGEIPEEVRPIHLSVRDPETDEPLDVDMSDDGLEGDAVAFVHDPAWEDINEEVEVRLARSHETPLSTRMVILNHHHRAGTLKLRRMDEEIFTIQGPLSRIQLKAHDGEDTEDIGCWASRDSGLIYGLGTWFIPRTPRSGGTLLFERETPGGPLHVRVGEPDRLTNIEANRAEELQDLREASAYMSLFELLQTIMGAHQSGLELPTLWAEVNMVRRTSKRLVCSVLSAYHSFYFKQRGPKQILWRFDAGRLDQGFKRNKRKYVRR